MVGSVTPSDFNNFLRLFGNIAEALPNAKSLYSQRWFHDFLSVDEVMRLLADQPAGTFLVRYSRSLPGSFVLDYVPSAGQLKTLIIKACGSNGVEYVDEEGHAHMYPSIGNLVATQKGTNSAFWLGVADHIGAWLCSFRYAQVSARPGFPE